MKYLPYASLAFVTCMSALADEQKNSTKSLEQIYNEELAKIKLKYREGLARRIKGCDKVQVFLTKFDDLKESGENFGIFEGEEKKDSIHVAPYKQNSEILKSVTLNKDQQKELLNALSSQMSIPKHTGGAFCHFPIHGVRVFKGDYLVYEGSFCWECSNFSFQYPQGGSEWLDTSKGLKDIFLKVMPIPQSEIDRFTAKYKTPKVKAEPKETQK